MIVVKLMGGLGNQMFEYAAGKALAERTGAELKMDLSFFDTEYPNMVPRKYELGVFSVTGKIADKRDALSFRSPVTLANKVFRKFLKTDILRDRRFFREKGFPFNRDFLNLKDPVYLEGYWQSEKYFRDVSEKIRKEFEFREPPAGKNPGWIETIRGTESVAVHFRRGDYVSLAQVSKTHGTCSMDYYREGISILAKKLRDPVFFIFSDEPDWVRDNFKIDHPMEIVDANTPDTGFEDLRLMRECRHFIIANSSFSWWGAWLSDNPRKTVITPKRWFLNDTDTSDLIPEGWIRI